VEVTAQPPVIAFYAEDGNEVASLGTPTASVPSLNLYGEHGTLASLSDGVGDPALGLLGQGKSDALLDALEDGAAFGVTDRDGFSTLIGVTTLGDLPNGGANQFSAASVTM
jgi:hypothetical protein